MEPSDVINTEKQRGLGEGKDMLSSISVQHTCYCDKSNIIAVVGPKLNWNVFYNTLGFERK